MHAHCLPTHAPITSRSLAPCKPRLVVHTPLTRKPQRTQWMKSVAATASIQADDASLRAMWDSVQKELLRVGKQGVSHAQARSLQTLLEAHGLVKVKVNDSAEAAATAAHMLAEEAEAVVLQQKGSTLLFASAHASPADLQAIASTNLEKKAQNQLHKERKRTDPYALLDARIRDRLIGLRSAGVIKDGTFDRRAIMCLAELPPSAALDILKPLNKAFMRQITSPSGWLTTQCKTASERAR